MKIIILLIAVGIFSCNSGSNQKQVYNDSAEMFLDSMEKYKPGIVTDDLAEIVRKNRYIMYEIMYRHYKEKADELK